MFYSTYYRKLVWFLNTERVIHLHIQVSIGNKDVAVKHMFFFSLFFSLFHNLDRESKSKDPTLKLQKKKKTENIKIVAHIYLTLDYIFDFALIYICFLFASALKRKSNKYSKKERKKSEHEQELWEFRTHQTSSFQCVCLFSLLRMWFSFGLIWIIPNTQKMSLSPYH